MRIALIGCGGIGGIVAGCLALKGLDIVCIEVNRECADRISEKGIHITGKKGEFRTDIRARAGFDGKSGGFDLIIIAVKNNVLRTVFSEAKKHLDPGGIIVTLQNGVEVISIYEENPDIEIVAGAVGYNSVMISHGEYFVTSDGGITFGSLRTESHRDLSFLKDLFEPMIEVTLADNIGGVLWAKLLIVCGVTGLGGVAGVRTGELLREKVARRLFYEIVTEGAAVAERLGVKVEKFGGAINPVKFGNIGGYPLFIRYILLKIVGLKYRDLKSNIHHSIDRGEKTEVDYINGAVVKHAERLGVAVPVNAMVVKMVKEIEEGKRKMGPDNLYEIYDRLKKQILH